MLVLCSSLELSIFPLSFSVLRPFLSPPSFQPSCTLLMSCPPFVPPFLLHWTEGSLHQHIKSPHQFVRLSSSRSCTELYPRRVSAVEPSSRLLRCLCRSWQHVVKCCTDNSNSFQSAPFEWFQVVTRCSAVSASFELTGRLVSATIKITAN